jgi:hypothetical protein
MLVVPFLIGCLRRTPETYHLAGIRRGTATSKFHVQRDNLAARINPSAVVLQVTSRNWPSGCSGSRAQLSIRVG